MGLIAIIVITAIVPQRDGFLALAEILVPHLFLVALVLVPFTLVMRHPVFLSALGVLIVLGAVRFGPDWVSFPPGAGDGAPVRVMSWNLEAGRTTGPEIVEMLLANEADVVAIQELRPNVVVALDADPTVVARYPYRLLVSDPTVLGIGLLSAYPIETWEPFEDPPGLQARLDIGDGRTLSVINAHPLPGRIGLSPFGLPITFDGTARDVALGQIRERIDELIADAEAFVVLGDYNVTPLEPGYALLAAGLRDAHAEVGLGSGWTWRPPRIRPAGFGVLRIDYVFGGPTVAPISTAVDCGYRGDHCLLSAVVEVP